MPPRLLWSRAFGPEKIIQVYTENALMRRAQEMPGAGDSKNFLTGIDPNGYGLAVVFVGFASPSISGTAGESGGASAAASPMSG